MDRSYACWAFMPCARYLSVPAFMVCGAVFGFALIHWPAFVWLEITGGATEADTVVIPPTVCGTCGGAIIGSGCAVAFVVLVGIDRTLWKSEPLYPVCVIIKKMGNYSSILRTYFQAFSTAYFLNGSECFHPKALAVPSSNILKSSNLYFVI